MGADVVVRLADGLPVAENLPVGCVSSGISAEYLYIIPGTIRQLAAGNLLQLLFGYLFQIFHLLHRTYNPPNQTFCFSFSYRAALVSI